MTFTPKPVTEFHVLAVIQLDGLTLRYADTSMSMSDGNYYDGRLRVSTLQRAFSSFTAPKQRQSTLTITLMDADLAIRGLMDQYYWGNRDVLIMIGEGRDLVNYITDFHGVIKFPAGITFDRTEVQIKLRDVRNRDVVTLPLNKFNTTDYPNLEDGAEGEPIPLVYGDWTDTGVPATCIDTTTNTFKFCDRAVKEIVGVSKNGEVISWSNEDLDAATLRIVDYSPGEDQILVYCKGIVDGEGNLVENPAAVLYDLQTELVGIETPVNLITDGMFEYWASANNLTNWTESVAGSSTINRDDTVTHGGSYSVRLDIDASNSIAQIYRGDLVEASLPHVFSFWHKETTGGSMLVQLRTGEATPRYLQADGSWSTTVAYLGQVTSMDMVKVEIPFTAPNWTGAYRVLFARNNAANCSIWIADARIQLAGSTIDTDSYDTLAADTADFTCRRWIGEEISSETIIEELAIECLFDLFIVNDQYTVRSRVPSAVIDTSYGEMEIAPNTLRVEADPENLYTNRIKCEYEYHPDVDKHVRYLEQNNSQEQTNVRQIIPRTITFNWLYVTNDVATVAGHLNLLYAKEIAVISFTAFGGAILTQLADRLGLTFAHYVDRPLVVREITKNFQTMSCTIYAYDEVLHVLPGYWTAEDAPDFATASVELRAIQGFWANDDGLADPADEESVVSAYW